MLGYLLARRIARDGDRIPHESTPRQDAALEQLGGFGMGAGILEVGLYGQ